MANQSKSPNEPARVVLEGVPRVGFGVIEEGRDVEGCPLSPPSFSRLATKTKKRPTISNGR
jgi:hypothetical protein